MGFLDKYPRLRQEGTEWLRSMVSAKVYAGDDFIGEKLVEAQLNWLYYNNKHWREHNDRLMSFNYCRALIDRVIMFFMGRDGFEINVEDLYGEVVEEGLERGIESFLVYNWRRNNKMTFFQKVLQMGSITGDAYIFLYPNLRERFVEYVLLDTRNTIPEFVDGDFSRVEGYKIVTPLVGNVKGYVSRVEEYRVGKKTTYYVKETKSTAEKFEYVEQVYDVDFLPIVHIENIATSDRYGGLSDIKDVIKLNRIFNEMAEDVKDIIDYHSSPVTIITGGTVGNLKRGLGQIWSGLPAEAQVFNLELRSDMGANLAYLNMLREAMHDLTGVPQEVLSKVQHISNTSAAALNMLYQSIVQAADRKGVTYGEGLTRLHRMTMMMAVRYFRDHPLIRNLPKEAFDDGGEFFLRYAAIPVFKYNLPVDRKSLLDELAVEMNLGLASKREAMSRLGKRNIPLIMKEVEEEEKKRIQQMKEVEGKGGEDEGE